MRTAPVKDEAASRPPGLHYELRIADHALECRSIFAPYSSVLYLCKGHYGPHSTYSWFVAFKKSMYQHYLRGSSSFLLHHDWTSRNENVGSARAAAIDTNYGYFFEYFEYFELEN